MKHYAAILAAIIGLSANAATLTDIAEHIERSAATYGATCSYEVLLPSLAEPVTYSVTLQATQHATGDTLAPCDYIIDWNAETPSGPVTGFSAYYSGNHYRYRDKRLQEYHAGADDPSLAPGGDPGRGVQSVVQFADLLPAFIADRFRRMASDSTYHYQVHPDTIVGGIRSVAVDGVRRINGYDAAEFLYVLHPDTYLPRTTELENNPGQLGEQSIIVRYTTSDNPGSITIDESLLAQRYPAAFGEHRGSAYSLEKMPGHPLPRIVAPTADGDRYVHDRGQALPSPTIVVFIDATVGSTPAVIKAVRGAVDTAPVNIDILWAFLNHRADDIRTALPNVRSAEKALINARSAATACGIGADTPVLLFVKSDGKIYDFVRGFNQDLESIVIQKAGLMD